MVAKANSLEYKGAEPSIGPIPQPRRKTVSLFTLREAGVVDARYLATGVGDVPKQIC